MTEYRAADNLCAVDLSSLKLPVSDFDALKILEILGFSIEKTNISRLAWQCIGRSEYELGAHPNNAPHSVDCSSFTRWLYSQRGIWIPRLSIQQRSFGTKVDISEIRPDDLVFTRSGCGNYFEDDPLDNVGHVGVYIGNGVVHAHSKRYHVVLESLGTFAKSGFRGVRRYIPAKSSALTLRIPKDLLVESSDDIRWIILRNLKLLE